MYKLLIFNFCKSELCEKPSKLTTFSSLAFIPSLMWNCTSLSLTSINTNSDRETMSIKAPHMKYKKKRFFFLKFKGLINDISYIFGFPGDLVEKNLPATAGDVGSIPGPLVGDLRL